MGVKFYEEIQHMPRVVAYMKSVHEHEVEDRMRFYECGVKEGLFRSDIDYPFISNVGHITMNEIMHLQLYRMYSMQTIFDNFFMVIVRGTHSGALFSCPFLSAVFYVFVFKNFVRFLASLEVVEIISNYLSLYSHDRILLMVWL